MALDLTTWIVFITLLLIYGLTLCWDLLKRDEPYGNFAYITALLPANYLWYAVMVNGYNGFNALGAAAFLISLWFIAMLRDIYTTRVKKKDLDDVVLYLLIGIIIQLILYAVLPSNGVINVLNDTLPAGTGGTFQWYVWYFPNVNYDLYSGGVLAWFRLVTTALIAAVIAPMILDLKGTKVHPWILILITILFAIPFSFLGYIWTGDSQSWIAILFLLEVLLLIMLLMIAR